MILGFILAAVSPAMAKTLPVYQLPGLGHHTLRFPVRLPAMPLPVTSIGRPAVELPAPRAIPVLFSSALQMKSSVSAPNTLKAVVGRPAAGGLSLKVLNKLFDNAVSLPGSR